MDSFQEIRAEIEELRTRIDELKARLDGIDPAGAPDAPAMEPLNIPFDDMPDDTFFFIQRPANETPQKPVEELQSVPRMEDPEEPVQDGPAPGSADVSVDQPSPGKPRTPRSWMLSSPGTPVGNIVSGIPLNDRVLYINALFHEDPLLFNATVAELNKMSSIEEAEDYIEEHFPEWNLNSKTVFKFMMAVRRKLG